MIAVLCPRAQWAEQLAGELDGAAPENWAPFRAWRGGIPKAGMVGGSIADEAVSAQPNAEAFILVCGEGQRAAIAGALQLLTVCPGAPILQFDACWTCDATDPALKAGQLIVCESARAFRKEELYLLHASPAPIADLAAAVPDAGLFEKAAKTLAAPNVSVGSCDAAIDFPTQREWLHRKYGFRAFDTISHAVGSTIHSNGGAWLGVGLVVGLAEDSATPKRRLLSPQRECLRRIGALLRAIAQEV